MTEVMGSYEAAKMLADLAAMEVIEEFASADGGAVWVAKRGGHRP